MATTHRFVKLYQRSVRRERLRSSNGSSAGATGSGGSAAASVAAVGGSSTCAGPGGGASLKVDDLVKYYDKIDKDLRRERRARAPGRPLTGPRGGAALGSGDRGGVVIGGPAAALDRRRR